MRNKKPRPTLLIKGIGAYIEWYRELMKHTFIITPEGNFYLVDGIRIDQNSFENSLPMPTLIKNGIDKGNLLDGRIVE